MSSQVDFSQFEKRKKRIGQVRRFFAIYALPLYLVLIEWVMNSVAVIGHKSALGPSLVAISLGFIGPVVVPKDVNRLLPEDVRKTMHERSLAVTTERDSLLIFLASICIILY